MQKEKTKSNFWKPLLITIGVLIGLGIIAVTIIIVTLLIVKPFDINLADVPGAIINATDTESSYDHPLLSSDQEVMLESVGIDTTQLPTEITTEQVNCGAEALGQERVDEIMAGSQPTFTDILNAQHCY